jgi:magnesium/cobalt transport protein CorA
MQRLVIANHSGCTPFAADASVPDEGYVWLDAIYHELDELTKEITRLTGATLFENHTLDARNLGHPSFFESTERYEMIVFRGLVPGSGRAKIDTQPLFVFRFDRLVATLRSPENRSCESVKERFRSQGARVPRNPDELVHRLLSSMVDQYLDLRQGMIQRIEQWQRQLLDPRRPFSDWYGLLEQRNEVRKLEHLSEGQLDAVQEWRDARFEDLSSELQVRFTDLVEHIQRVLAHARRVEATIESAVQLHFSAVSNRTSEIMRTLTLITAIFMPLTLITGIFGMNFELIPGLHSQYGFWFSLAGMALVVVVMLLYFRFRRWI